MTISELAPFLAPLLMLATVLGGLWAFRRSTVQQMGVIQGKVVEAYKEQNEAQERQIHRLRSENVAMRAAFKQLGIDIEIISEQEIILTQREPASKQTRITNVHINKEGD